MKPFCQTIGSVDKNQHHSKLQRRVFSQINVFEDLLIRRKTEIIE